MSAAASHAKVPQLVLALDHCSDAEARALVAEVQPAGLKWVKVGLELYTRAGTETVQEFKRRGLNVFLDLKLHDIPNTVAQATQAAAHAGADILTVHAAGGPRMLEAARDAARGTSLAVVAVTVLTSLDASELVTLAKVWGTPHPEAVPRNVITAGFARIAAESGLHGIVSSVSDLHDGAFSRLPWRQSPIFITPGIRPAAITGANHAGRDDQRSTGSIEQAVLAGSTHLVVGRPIHQRPPGERVEATRRLIKEIEDTYAFAAHPERS